MDFDGSEQFSGQNPQNFGAWGKVLPERDQKRSGRENHIILESATETCSKHDFSMIFVGYSSRIFYDFQGFSQISMFLHTVLSASRKRIASKERQFGDSTYEINTLPFLQRGAYLFLESIHFELARLAAGPTVDTLQVPIDYFRRF